MIKGSLLRTEIMLGKTGVGKLSHSFVVIAGAGAVGGWALEALVRVGVGRIRIIDYDVVDVSNLNRQVLATADVIGQYKVDLAVKRALSINPDIQIEPKNMMISAETIEDVFEDEPDLLIDAIDTVACKVQLLKSAVNRNIPVFSSMGAALRTDMSMIKTVSLDKTKVCPLAKIIRSGLKKENVDISRIMAVCSEELPKVIPDKRDGNGKSVLGSLPTVPAVFGFTLANMAILHLVDYKGEN